jgi:ArsR family transcriptional regulator
MKRIKKLWNMENSGLLEIFFKGLADVSRLRILSLLLHGELCGCDIQYVLDASQSNVSRHLTYLKNSGLVLDRRSGYRVYYRLTTKLSADHRLLFDYLERAFRRERLFAEDLKKLKDAIKEGACTASDRQAVTANHGKQQVSEKTAYS